MSINARLSELAVCLAIVLILAALTLSIRFVVIPLVAPKKPDEPAATGPLWQSDSYWLSPEEIKQRNLPTPVAPPTAE